MFIEISPIWFLVEKSVEYQMCFEIAIEKHTNYGIDNFKVFEDKEHFLNEFKALKKHPFLIFIDIDNFNGFDLLKDLKNEDEKDHIPICIISKGVSFKDIEISRLRKSCGYIQKVLDAELLASRILFFIERRILEGERNFLILINEE